MRTIVTAIPAFEDNYIWVISQTEFAHVVVVDPGHAIPVIDFLNKNNLGLYAILLTHHHADHIDGVGELLDYASVPVYGPRTDEISVVSKVVSDGTTVDLPDMNLRLQVMAIPAHTLDHVAYFSDDLLFCGDTLFTGGCGRIFEGTPAQMLTALQNLAALGPQMKIYCGHEYTVENLKFAHKVEPSNLEIVNRLNAAELLREQDLPTVPSTMHDELATNPFLRTEIPEVIESVCKHARKTLTSPVEIFAALREWKNSF